MGNRSDRNCSRTSRRVRGRKGKGESVIPREAKERAGSLLKWVFAASALAGLTGASGIVLAGNRRAWRVRPEIANGSHFYVGPRRCRARRLRAFCCRAAPRDLVSWRGGVVPVRELVVRRRFNGAGARRIKAVSDGGSHRSHCSCSLAGSTSAWRLWLSYGKLIGKKPDQNNDE